MNRLKALMVVMGVCLMAIPLTIARSAAGDATGLQEELDKLEGNWELVSSSVVPEGKLKRVTKQNKGDKETVTRYDDAGNVTGGHLVDVKLSRVGKVTIFTYSNMKIVAGPGKGRTVAGADGRGSFIYRLDKDTFYVAGGLLEGEAYGRTQPSLDIWKRVR
jgi:hypothetical protein